MERHHTQVKGRGQSENRKAAKATAGNYGIFRHGISHPWSGKSLTEEQRTLFKPKQVKQVLRIENMTEIMVGFPV